MAKSDTLVPTKENPTVGETQPIPEQDTTETAVDETVEGAESSPEPKVDYEGKFRAYEERLTRAEERNRYLEQTARLLEEDRQNRQHQQQTPQKSDAELSAELLDLDKTLDPLFNKRLKGLTQPLVDTVSRLYDEQDSSRFEMYLMRNHPDVFEEEGGIDKVFQEVEQVRQQAARNYNQWLSRVDAFLYSQGIRGVQEKYKTRKEKKSAQVHDEAKRLQSVKAAGSGVPNVQPKKVVGSDIQAIRDKAQRGDRLTDVERTKYRDFIADQTF
jgi:hypothetical protein